MDELIIIDQQGGAIERQPAVLPLDGLIAAWLHAKAGHSGSEHTASSYRRTLEAFRSTLQQLGLDLDGETTAVALAAQGWAAQSSDGRELAPATYNQRLAIISSFYQYANKHGQLDGNPIARVERRFVQVYGSAQGIEPDVIKRRLSSIDRSQPAGLRDYALLLVGLHTGRRVAELASLRWSHVQRAGERVTLNFPRAKGGKQVRDQLPVAAARALLAWLHEHYGQQLGDLAPSAPLWPSLSPRNRGEAMSVQTMSDICARRLGVSKVHALRHTFARAMETAGAKVSDIQGRLGHSSLQTTGRYLSALRSAENSHGDMLSTIFGVDEE